MKGREQTPYPHKKTVRFRIDKKEDLGIYNDRTLPLSTTYSNEDYSSNDGMLTTVWGPSMWHTLHTMSFNYPVHPTEQQKTQYYQFIMNLRNVLPCGKCRENLCKNFKKLPLRWSSMKNRDTFSRYVYDLHEVINKMLEKKSGLSYEMVRERYEHFRSRCVLHPAFKNKNKNKNKRGTRKKTPKHKGCTEPLYGEKAKCILKIVPQARKCDTFSIEKQCIKTK